MVLVHPEYAMLILEVYDLREQVAKLIAERDMLLCYTCTDIEMDYMLKIGAIEYKLVVAGNIYRKNLRKLEIIEKKLEKKLPIKMAYINRTINSEFKHKMEMENNLSRQIDLAIEMSELEPIDKDILEEMTFDYIKLQKLYNPIFDLEKSKEREKNYDKIEKYYQKGNYKKIHKLAEEYNDDDNIIEGEIDTLKMVKEMYQKLFQLAQKQVRKIKNSFPYNQKVILEDETLCRRKKDSLNKEIMEITIENKKIEKKIENKLKKLT